MTEENFTELMDRWSWRPIRNCPGRFVLMNVGELLPMTALVSAADNAAIHQIEGLPDKVAVLQFPGGGLISYVRSDGTILHTLNTVSGFSRKLTQLGIAP